MSDHRSRVAVSRLARTLGIALVAGVAMSHADPAASWSPQTTTPIEHLVVIFQENVSFDHYFATYPVALNPPGEPRFHGSDDTPSVNGLGTLADGLPEGELLTHNPNANNPGNGANAINPFRLDRSQASTCDQDHNYGAEQQAFDGGLMDMFPASVGQGASGFCAARFAYGKGQGIVMGYFDGNTVTALWNYAQQFAMNDNSYGTTFGPSTPGVLNLVAGTTFAATASAATPKVVPDSSGPGTLVGDLDPTGDVCSAGATVRIAAPNIGDLLNAKGVTWGAFMGGFDLTVTNANGTTGCRRSSPATAANGGPTADYIPHHAFFQYFASTANPTHERPKSLDSIGTGDDGGANHQYDLHDFFDALAQGRLPAVSFLKAIAAQDGHAGYSDPLLEQPFLVKTVNALMSSPQWRSTAIVILYDDSDGWYDHQMSPIVNPSALTGPVNDSDQLNGAGVCGHGAAMAGIPGRCGYGPRMPLVVISPLARRNFVDHTLADQSSVLRFIEDNWETGRLGGGSYDRIAGSLLNMFDFDERGEDRRLFLDPTTGEP
ncbi:MAG TPA: alkaline phosphatase family protein [Steroidobacteraceae bacterium]|nr:alkaline phosphatase family protein [Steroidobacteraceae bacterium]